MKKNCSETVVSFHFTSTDSSDKNVVITEAVQAQVTSNLSSKVHFHS